MNQGTVRALRGQADVTGQERRIAVRTTGTAALGLMLAVGAAVSGVAVRPADAGLVPVVGDRAVSAHVFVIVMENHGYADLIGSPAAPWITHAAATYGVADTSFAITHPSQANYIALTSGGIQGVTDDGDVTVDATNLADQVEGAGLTWTAYMQSLDACGGDVLRAFCGGQLYARKHDPFASYRDIASDPARLARIVDLSALNGDLATGSVPDLVWITPDQCHDMHGIEGSADAPCDGADDQQRIAAGDAFLATTVDSITASTSWTLGSSIFITWDEAGFQDTSGCCTADPGGGHILTLVIGQGQQVPLRSVVPYNHYSLLASVEQLLGLDCLGQACAVAPMADLLAVAAVPDAPPASPARSGW